MKLVKTLDGTGEILEDQLMMTDSEAGTAGEAVTVTSGRLTKTAATAKPDYILAISTDAGTDVKTLYSKVREDNIYEIGITGTGTITAGLVLGNLDTTATLLDAAAQTGGVTKVLWADNTAKLAHIRF